MKLRIFLFLLFSSALLNVRAYTVLNLDTGEIEETTNAPTYDVVCENLSNGFRITYTFDKIGLLKDSVGDSYRCFITGFGSNTIVGLPDVPLLTESLLVPEGAEYTLKIKESQTSDYGLKISNVVYGDTSFPYAALDFEQLLPAFYPSATVTLDGVQVYRGNYLQYFTVSPVQYNRNTGKAKVLKKLPLNFIMAEPREYQPSPILVLRVRLWILMV